jgi:hypothetical protein
MSSLFDCQCIFVEMRNPGHPKSGCIEYRAETCRTCQSLDTRLLAGTTAVAVFEAGSPKQHQRLH